MPQSLLLRQHSPYPPANSFSHVKGGIFSLSGNHSIKSPKTIASCSQSTLHQNYLTSSPSKAIGSLDAYRPSLLVSLRAPQCNTPLTSRKVPHVLCEQGGKRNVSRRSLRREGSILAPPRSRRLFPLGLPAVCSAAKPVSTDVSSSEQSQSLPPPEPEEDFGGVLEYSNIINGLTIGASPCVDDEVQDIVEQLKVNAFLSLQTDECFEALDTDWETMRESMEKRGAFAARVPMPDFDNTAQSLVLPDAVRVLAALIETGHHVYVSCTSGKHRSPLVAMGYLTFVKGLDYKEARQIMNNKSPTAHPSFQAWEEASSRLSSSCTQRLTEIAQREYEKRKSEGRQGGPADDWMAAQRQLVCEVFQKQLEMDVTLSKTLARVHFSEASSVLPPAPPPSPVLQAESPVDQVEEKPKDREETPRVGERSEEERVSASASERISYLSYQLSQLESMVSNIMASRAADKFVTRIIHAKEGNGYAGGATSTSAHVDADVKLTSAVPGVNGASTSGGDVDADVVRVEKVTHQLDVANEKISNLSLRLSEMQSLDRERKDEAEETADKIADLSKMLEAAVTKERELSEALKNSNYRIKQLMEEAAKNDALSVESSNQIVFLSQHVESLDKELKEARANAQSIQEHAESEMKELRNTLTRLNEDVERVRRSSLAAQQEAEGEVSQLSSRIKSLENALEQKAVEVAKERSEREKQVGNLKRELERAQETARERESALQEQREGFRSEMERLSLLVSDLTEEVEGKEKDWANEMSGKSKEIAALKVQITELERANSQKIAEMEGQTRRGEEERRGLEERILSMEAEAGEKEREREGERREMRREAAELREKISLLESASREAGEEVGRLRQAYGEKEREVRMLEEALNAQENREAEVEAMSQLMREQIELMRSEMKGLEVQLLMASEEIVGVEIRARESMKQQQALMELSQSEREKSLAGMVEELKNTLSQRAQELAQVQEELNVKDNTITDLQGKESGLVAEVSAVSEKCQKLEEQISQLQEQFSRNSAAWEAERVKLQEKIKMASTSPTSSSPPKDAPESLSPTPGAAEEISSLRSAVSALRDELSAAKKATVYSNEKIGFLTRKINLLQEKETELRKSMQNPSVVLAELSGEVKALRLREEASKRQLREMENQVREMQARDSANQDALKVANTKIEFFHRQMQLLREKKEATDSELSEARAMIKRLREQQQHQQKGSAVSGVGADSFSVFLGSAAGAVEVDKGQLVDRVLESSQSVANKYADWMKQIEQEMSKKQKGK